MQDGRAERDMCVQGGGTAGGDGGWQETAGDSEGCWYKVSFSSQIFLSAFYIIVLKPGTNLDFFIPSLIPFVPMHLF